MHEKGGGNAWLIVVDCMKQLFRYQNIDIEIRNKDGYTAFEIIEQATRNLLFMSALKAEQLWRAFAAFGKYCDERDEAR